MRYLIIGICLAVILTSCSTNETNSVNKKVIANISEATTNKIVEELASIHGSEFLPQIERGVVHAASLWRNYDGSEEEFIEYCKTHFVADAAERKLVFDKISRNLEILLGYFNRITLDLNKPLQEPNYETHNIDGDFGGYNPSAHLIEDMYANKIAFYVALNFPFYSLDEKNQLGTEWSRQDWAYARLGDVFTSRIPAELVQNVSKVSTESDMYISAYNIFMGKLVDENGNTFFPADMVLLSHWNLRDEIKANYNGGNEGLEKQALIYRVMKRIIDQTIPEKVINSGEFTWNPVTNKVFGDAGEITLNVEPDTRYQQIIDNYNVLSALDKYSPLNTAVERAFAGEMEISHADIEELFTNFLASEEVKEVAKLISQRLGRELKPWDIWYDGFKARSNIDEDMLNGITQKRYPNAAAFEKDLPNMLLSLGFSKEKAIYLADKIVVDPARGSGHAWGAQMKGDVAHLRTRIPEKGMNYKGYNIAVHEFGHNVEQSFSLYDVDYYMLNGVPNTAFTEALAFIFQKRDLEILGINNNDKQKEALATLDIFWSTYEIMGVSLLDQRIWKWLYENPTANANELKTAVISMAKDIWNEFYAPVFGSKDETILAVYSHMISYPLYLSNYAVGNLIEFQIEQHLKNSDFASEVERMYKIGNLTPNAWMQEAVGKNISSEALLKQTSEALKVMN